MDTITALNIVNAYVSYEGYPDIESINSMKHSDFLKGLEEWPTRYIEALPDAGLFYKLSDKINHPQTGKIVTTEWGWKMEQVHKTVEFRESTEGKKHILRTITPGPIRNEENDTNDMIDTASIRVSTATGSARKVKKQTQLNLERMEHIKALERSISKGGAVRDVYEEVLDDHSNNVESLMTNEEAAIAAMKEKRWKRIPSLLLSWLVMPFYVILRAFDMILDSFVISYRRGINIKKISPKVGSNHKFFGRFSIPLVIATFLSFVITISSHNAGIEEYATRDPILLSIFLVPFYMIAFMIVKQFFDLPFDWGTYKYGIIALKASYAFEPKTAEEFQLGDVSETYELQDILRKMIIERENIINGLKDSIENNFKLNEYDEYRCHEDLSLKALKKEEIDRKKYLLKEQKKRKR